MSVVCLDTHILVWGIRREATQGQEDYIPHARFLLQKLNDENAKIIIPSIVLAEFLVRCPEDKVNDIIGLFERSFRVVPFNTIAARKAAELWRDKLPALLEEIKAFPDECNKTRQLLKVDCQIVATALAYNANVIYSNDSGMKKIGKGLIKVVSLDEVPFQPELFRESD